MNIQEEMYFKALTKERSEIAEVMERPAVRGYKDSVVEKYSDQAHFIYELLQNADDAHATNARFLLEGNRLIFTHNGTRHFTVTNPENENKDTINGTLGDINAITSIANSNKTSTSIGKFGVGFKAVFQYTSTPHIYDPNFKFRIEKFLVPILLEKDFPRRRADETIFVFPFDHPERDAKEAYKDISEKLKNLSYPLLFLTNLKEIEFEYESVLGLYGKNVTKIKQFGDTIAEQLVLTQNNGDELFDVSLWLFSRLDEYNRRYSVGFFMDQGGNLKPVNKPAFCFFPTKEMTNLNFIIHAPFLLTDSREGIRTGLEHNDNMINYLADLSADALEYLRDIGLAESKRLVDDNIVNIVPIDNDLFSARQGVSFFPFYESIKQKFLKTKLIPSNNGYIKKENAYWAAFPQHTQLFSNVQLADIVDNQNAQWAFVSHGRDEVQRNSKALFLYIEDLVKTNLNEDALITGRSRETYYNRYLGVVQTLENVKGITIDFIENQPIHWLQVFYKWLSETKHRTEIIKDKPIFLDQNNKAVAAYDKEGQLILFLPVKNIVGYTFVNEALMEKEETKKFLESIGVKQPSLKDQIYNIILPLYQQGGGINTEPHFLIFFEYYNKCSIDEVDEFIELIKDVEAFRYYNPNDKQIYRGSADSLYLPTPELCAYFETKEDTHFIALEEYKKMVGPAKEKQLIAFLIKLGVKQEVSIYKQYVDRRLNRRFDLPTPYSTRGHSWEEPVIDGCNEILDYIEENKDGTKSVILWNALLKIIEKKCSSWSPIGTLLRGVVHSFYYTPQTDYFESLIANRLKKAHWLKDNSGEFVTPSDLYQEFLADIYETNSEPAKQLLNFLGIQVKVMNASDSEEEDDVSYLTEEQREKIALADMLKANGIHSEEELAELFEIKRQIEARQQVATQIPDTLLLMNNSDSSSVRSNKDDTFIGITKEIEEEVVQTRENKAINKAVSAVIQDIVRRTKDKPILLPKYENDGEIDVDEDDLIPSAVDYSNRIERAKDKSATEIDRIVYFEALHSKAAQQTLDKKYSLAWFRTLLEMESINSGEANSRNRVVSISFAAVEKESGTQRTLVLKHPNRYIPQFMEDLADIPLVLHMGEHTKTVAIEVVNIKSYTLRVKMKNTEDLAGIDLSLVTSATIDAKSPAFLLEELRKRFNEFDLDENFNMKENLCENIEFVFGPPGTGKTTHLAKQVLLPLMINNSQLKVLVLTPTNKSADVLIRRIMEVYEEDKSYEDWLIRFGTTSDEGIEQSPIFRDKTFDIRTLVKHVIVTTIARFPYDYFMPAGERIHLHAINWDYIVIDEASMIPIANIVYPLFKKTPRQFIIAGDPFQIEPITSVDLWKIENIYTMVELKSFVNPVTKPHPYKVELLTTQFRSIPDIGDIFSNFAYGGILNHHRSSVSQRALNVGDDLGVETLNILKFPVSKYESIYRCKRLNHSSSYQVYSAIFTFEYVSYLSHTIAKNNPGEFFKIGVIAPYRAQADLIDKLMASEKLPKELDVQVGTIHGFQGDECDIIFAVLNPPPTISASQDMFLNKKNIINVSISRAKDYLFIVMPDDNTADVNNLRLVKRVENLIRKTKVWNEFSTPNLEELMFGDSKYLENNVFSTSHQSVNVYGLPEKVFEVRTEDTAIDVQIHRSVHTNHSTFVEGELPRTERNATCVDSYMLDESLIPVNLRKDATDLPVSGALNGWYFLVPYEGKLRANTMKKLTAMFIPQIRNGLEKMISVSTDEEARIIYISKDLFKIYEQGLSDPEGIKVERNRK